MAKTTKEKIEVMKAYEEGKQIECRKRKSSLPWLDWILPQEPAWDWENNDYEVKEEPTDRTTMRKRKRKRRNYCRTESTIESKDSRLSTRVTRF